ncbi:MAG: enkurin domain-containing protein [archaeon]|nr:enkurin domain-containing protein [archaeon]
MEIKKRPQSSRQITKRSKTYNELEIKEKPIEGLGMFEQYYYDKLKEKNLLKDHCGIYFDEEYQKYQRKEDEALKQIEEEKQKQNVKNIEEQLNEDYEQIKKTKLKEPTPKSTEFGLILPKSQKNFIGENRKLISAKKYVIKGNSQHLEENPFHKNYGKTPSYIEHRKIEAEIQRELEERKRKEAKYPKGTRLLKEEERLKTLQGLQESKRDIINCIERLPITMSSIASQKRKEELEKKLQEVEDAIITFSRKEVFIRVDD